MPLSVAYFNTEMNGSHGKYTDLCSEFQANKPTHGSNLLFPYMRLTALFILFIFLVESRGQAQSNTVKTPATVAAFVTYLDSTDYMWLFMAGMDTEADSLWREPGSEIVFKKIVESDSINVRAQFFAAEILFDHAHWNPEGELRKKVAVIYATALRENYAGMGNPWGLPEDNGDIGKRIDTLGEVIVDAFRPLLSCRKPVYYAGSKTATMGRIYKYRVKDIAAAHICEARKYTFYGGVKPVVRSLQIAWLKLRLVF